MRHLLLLMFLSFNLFAAELMPLSLRPDYPKRYTVQPGDTLWDIATKYLNAPWQWKRLWHANPSIKNPNHLYPGAILELVYEEGHPRLRILSNGTVKLSPNVRPVPIGDPIPAIPLVDIKPFLNASLIMNDVRLDNAPYIVAFMGEHMLGGQGDEVYVKNLHPSPIMPRGTTISYAVYRPGCPYLDPKTKELLGYKASLIGYGELEKGGDPAVMLLTDITEGVRLKDRVLYNDFPEFKLNFEPQTPRSPIKGSIIELPPAYTQGAVGLVAVLNRGQNARLEPGDVLGIYSPPRMVRDPLCCKMILLPRERIGELMIFRTFSKTSFALVVRSTQAVHLGDIVTNP